MLYRYRLKKYKKKIIRSQKKTPVHRQINYLKHKGVREKSLVLKNEEKCSKTKLGVKPITKSI